MDAIGGGGNLDIYVMNPDGSGETRLTNDPGSDRFPVWSPDGSRLAFQSNRSGRDLIYSMDVDGSNLTKITQNQSNNDKQPSWSPDGSRITFISDRLGDGNQIYTMNPDGSGVTRLTDVPNKDASPGGVGVRTPIQPVPKPTPDGTKIAFESDRDGNNEIYVMNADGSNQTRLTNNPADDTEPSWSPRR
jgi:TolB protein